MDTKKIRNVIQKRSQINDEWEYGVEQCQKDEIAILAENIPATIEYLEKDCTEDEFAWISEIIDELISITQNKDLLACYKELMSKFPNACATYNIQFCVECAESMLDA